MAEFFIDIVDYYCLAVKVILSLNQYFMDALVLPVLYRKVQ